jgi:hypothetical protein
MGMPRSLLVLAVAAIAGATPAASHANAPLKPAPAPVATAVVVPAALQALEPKMLALQLTSERFSATLSVAAKPTVKGLGGVGPLFGHASSVAEALLTATGVVSFIPQAAQIEVSLLGVKVEARLIGTTLYLDEPFIARLDGGRPWVEQRNQTLRQTTDGLAPSAPAGAVADGNAGLVSIINGARSIHEIGPATVDGQATTAFKVSVEVARLATLTAHQRHTLGKVLKPLATVEVLIAENGLPVRTRVVLALRHDLGELVTQSDVLAVNVPVVVQPPPANKTISQAKVTRLLKRRRPVPLRGKPSRGPLRSHSKTKR